MNIINDMDVSIADNGYMVAGDGYCEVITEPSAPAYFGGKLVKMIRDAAKTDGMSKVKINVTITL